MTTVRIKNPLSTAEAAEMLGISRRRVAALIAAGRLKTTRVGRTHVIDEADLEAVRDRNSKGGRPRKTE